jgi:hypothetical protein
MMVLLQYLDQSLQQAEAEAVGQQEVVLAVLVAAMVLTQVVIQREAELLGKVMAAVFLTATF